LLSGQLRRDELGFAFAFGFCIDPPIPFYLQRGWHEVAERVMIDQPTGKHVNPLHCVVRPFGVEQWPREEVDIGGLPW